jgi:hypothetical protein
VSDRTEGFLGYDAKSTLDFLWPSHLSTRPHASNPAHVANSSTCARTINLFVLSTLADRDAAYHYLLRRDRQQWAQNPVILRERLPRPGLDDEAFGPCARPR